MNNLEIMANKIEKVVNPIIKSGIFKYGSVFFWVVYFGAVLFFMEVFITSCYLLGTGSFIYKAILSFVYVSPLTLVLIIPQMVFLFIILPFTITIDVAIIIRKYILKKRIPFHWKVVFVLSVLFAFGAVYVISLLNFSCR